MRTKRRSRFLMHSRSQKAMRWWSRAGISDALRISGLTNGLRCSPLYEGFAETALGRLEVTGQPLAFPIVRWPLPEGSMRSSGLTENGRRDEPILLALPPGYSREMDDGEYKAKLAAIDDRVSPQPLAPDAGPPLMRDAAHALRAAISLEPRDLDLVNERVLDILQASRSLAR